MLVKRRRLARELKERGEAGEHVERPPRKKVRLHRIPKEREPMLSLAVPTVIRVLHPVHARDRALLRLRLLPLSRVLLHPVGLSSTAFIITNADFVKVPFTRRR